MYICNIAFRIKLFTVLFLFACIHMLSEYGIADTTLGNAGWNSKPIDSYFFIIYKI